MMFRTFENDHLTLDIPGLAEEVGQLVSLAVPSSVHYNPGIVALDLGGPTIDIGKGGQIYSLAIPGAHGNVITNQREDSHWVDAVIETVATQSGIAHGGHPEAERWFQHQAGTYSRGPLTGKPGFQSPILWNHLNVAGGIYSTLNLAQQAHVEDNDFVSDRFVVYSRMKYVGGRVIEVTQAWQNHSLYRMPSSAGDGSSTWLDYFNFPWTVMRLPALPQALVGLAGGKRDVSNYKWTNHHAIPGARWFGLFSGSTGVAVIPSPGVTLTVGKVTKIGIVEEGKTRPPWTLVNTEQFIFCPAYGILLKRGEIVAARYYMVFGKPATAIARLAGELITKASVGVISIPQSNDPAHAVGFSRGLTGRLRRTATPETGEIILSSCWGTGMLPVYEISEGGRYRYSTDPYLGVRNRSYLTNSHRSIERIIGFIYASSAGTPFRAIAIGGAGCLIESDLSDAGYYLGV